MKNQLCFGELESVWGIALTDRAMHDYVSKAPENNGGVPDGVDAL